MGEGLREELVVVSAAGSGADGDATVSPTGSGDGRYFSLNRAPVVSGRTELYLNGSRLYGQESSTRTNGSWDSDGFSGEFDFRLDVSNGAIELQGASIGDQDGFMYSASPMNTGDTIILSGECGTSDLISVVDSSAPEERWTVRCVGVARDSNGDAIPGRGTFTVTGSSSGMLRDESGSPYLWDSGTIDSPSGGLSGSSSPTQGVVVAQGNSASSDGYGDSDDFYQDGTPVVRTPGDDSTDEFDIPGNILAAGQVMSGDYLVVDGGNPEEISDISYDSVLDITTITVENAALDATGIATPWAIYATNMLIDDPSEIHNHLDGTIESGNEGSFASSDVGKVVVVCGGEATGKYYITAVNSSRRVRLASFDDASIGLPSADAEVAGTTTSGGLIEGGGSTRFCVLQTNGVLLFGIQAQSIASEVGDKFYIDVKSRTLSLGDTLEARYIYELDLEDPEYFTSAQGLMNKHGTPSLTNTLSLGAQMAFENGAPAILALQCKPPLPRRTSSYILAEANDGVGGFSGGSEIDDLYFPIPRPVTGLLEGRPDMDTQVNIMIIRNGSETQIFPNKVGFYNSQYENGTGQTSFITGLDTAYSYTIVNTERDVLGSGESGSISSSSDEFSTAEFDFDGEDINPGEARIVIQSLTNAAGTVLTTVEDISTYLFGADAAAEPAELFVQRISDDNTVEVTSLGGRTIEAGHDATDVQFYIYNENSTGGNAALMLNRDLVDNQILQQGDGIRISYIDERDADYFDVNWFSAFERLEAADAQMIVPLPTQNRFGIFRAAVNHCETMSTIAIQKERMALFGAQRGVTAEALVGIEELAVEDIGVIEGVQGDDPEEVLDGNIEDLVNLKLNDNYTSNRAIYFFPDEIVRNVNGTNTFIDGFYMAACASGWLSARQNVAIPLTYKKLSGFSILRDKVFTKTMQNSIGSVGATLVTPVTGGGKILHARTTSNSGFVEDEEISIMFIRDRVKEILRQSLQGFLGTVENPNTQGLITARIINIMSGLVSQELITAFENVRVERDKVDPRQWNVFARFQPSYPINYIFVDLEVGVI
tara:strand:- start:2417 stop:5578 length:3162 start_codon:yes stop_codon:yes gene_type:complete